MNIDLVTRDEFNTVVEGLLRKINALETKAGRKYIPIHEAAEQLGVSSRTIKRRFTTINQGRRVYVLAQDLEA